MSQIIIKKGLIIDGTGGEGYLGDITATDGIITEVGEISSPTNARSIDARGLVVTPGFIDMHSHADFSLPVLPTAESLIHQGITTAVTGQCGSSTAPIPEPHREELISSFNVVDEIDGDPPWDEWTSFGEYLAYLERTGISINVVPLVGHGNIRASVMGFGAGNADQNQMSRMRAELLRALEEGAVGVSTGLTYPPGVYASTQEVIELVELAGRHNAFYFSHIRGGAATLLDSINEAIQIGEKTGARVQISHFKAAGRKNWNKSAKALDMIDHAIEKGLDIGLDVYPYTAGCTELAALLPAWVRDGGKEATLKRLSDSSDREKMAREMKSEGIAASMEWDAVLISDSRRRPGYREHFVSELAQNSGKTPNEWIFDALLENELQMTMIPFIVSEDNLRASIRHPSMTFGSDGIGLSKTETTDRSKPHPRSFGTFTRILETYVHNDGVLRLAEAVHKMTGLASKRLGLKKRGLIKPGFMADLVIFDPETIVDKATYEHPNQYPEGIHYVLVNGSIVLEEGIHIQTRPGKVLSVITV